MTEYGNYERAHDLAFGDPVSVPIVTASNKALEGYGHLVTDYQAYKVEITPWPVQGRRPLCPGTGVSAGECSGDFTCRWVGDQCIAANAAVDYDGYVIGRLPSNVSQSNRTHILVRDANYHPDGGQVFYPKNGGAFVALLAPPGDDVKMEDFRAYYFDGTCGLYIHPGVWHQPLYPLENTGTFLGRQGAVFACVSVDTVKEFGRFLKVPLTKPGA